LILSVLVEAGQEVATKDVPNKLFP
jgi:hypothetical protein